jgi:hypothetical protein
MNDVLPISSTLCPKFINYHINLGQRVDDIGKTSFIPAKNA